MDSLLNTTNIPEVDFQFTWHDYLLFCLMLLISVGIGLYFGCTGKKQSTADEYLFGGKEMGVVPIAMSLVSSYISGLTILAAPADMYKFGVAYGLNTMVIPLGIGLSYLTYVPVFAKLQLTSTFEYLKMRFSSKVRSFCSSLFTVTLIIYQPLVIYVPALALAQGTGFNIHYITPIICGTCIFYTTIGGIKAVVWTDTLQITLMIGSTIIFTYLGTAAVGGVGEVFRIASDGKRLDIPYTLDLTLRDSVWTGTIGTFFSWFVQMATGQACIQKYIALPSKVAIKKTCILFAIGMAAFLASSAYTGLMMYSRYHDCDPLEMSKINRNDQLLPYFVLDVSRGIPGLSGLFIAGIFSASLSTLSGSMNCLSCTLYEDFISNWVPKDITQKQVSNILKLIVVVVGVISTAFIYVLENLGGILEITFSLTGATAGPQLGLFTLGMFFPFANTKGALCGGVAATSIMAWIMLGSQYYKLNGLFSYPPLPTSTEGCSIVNSTFSPMLQTEWMPPSIYRISHYYYAMIGFILVLLVGLPISWFTRSNNPTLDKDLISPVMQWALPKEDSIAKRDYNTIDQALEVLKKNCDMKQYK